MTTTTTPSPAATFARVARRDACAAAVARYDADKILAAAQPRAAAAPADFHTPGGADAATLYRFMADDRDALANNAALASHHADAATSADDAPTAAHHADLARAYARSAAHDLDTMERYAALLP